MPRAVAEAGRTGPLRRSEPERLRPSDDRLASIGPLRKGSWRNGRPDTPVACKANALNPSPRPGLRSWSCPLWDAFTVGYPAWPAECLLGIKLTRPLSRLAAFLRGCWQSRRLCFEWAERSCQTTAAKNRGMIARATFPTRGATGYDDSSGEEGQKFGWECWRLGTSSLKDV